ncbi:AEC family transporter [Mesosutterella sp. AGMB02718]|uniref:AEC family transporter n=1 Tax=Mesosutterella faecium TaxID=2925194 RepID=A0ABT7IPH9_9BURK|nr:AEC family transporter [Mesosutterella sp. AGMB02718]MDL2060296.1 AEC family transporter [Mesosutterella sp. AGMB02718]
MAVAQQMLIFVLLMAAGAWARRRGILTPEKQPQLTNLVLNIAYPAIILSGVTGRGPRIGGAELAQAFLVIAALLAGLLACAWAIPRLLRFPKEERGAVNVMTVFTNIGFMGVPMIDGIYGKDALIYMTVLLIPFNLLFFSYVIRTIKGGGSETFGWKGLVSPGMLACYLSIAVYLSGIEVPRPLVSAIRMLGGMTAPLAMMLLGSMLLETDWKELFSGRIAAFTVLKMVVIPVAGTWLLSLFVHNTYLLAVCMAALATPSGNVIPLLAALYNKKAYPVTVQGIALTTAVSVFTMPLVALATGLG